MTTPLPPTASRRGHGHSWMMWLMCLPMLLVVDVLMATNALGFGSLFYAVGCLALMGAMMLWMNHGNSNGNPS